MTSAPDESGKIADKPDRGIGASADSDLDHEAVDDFGTASRRHEPRGRLTLLLMQVFWPAFLGAGISVGLVFSLLDPLQVDWVHEHLGGSREGAYTIAFFGFWCLHALACALTWFLSQSERRRQS